MSPKALATELSAFTVPSQVNLEVLGDKSFKKESLETNQFDFTL